MHIIKCFALMLGLMPIIGVAQTEPKPMVLTHVTVIYGGLTSLTICSWG